MTMTGVRSLAGKALVMGALGLSALGSAQATLVVGVWDPVYDSGNFGDMGWRGKIELNVPSTCLSQPAGAYLVSALPCIGTVITSAVVELYDDLQVGQPTLESLDLLALGAWLPTDITAIELGAPGVVIGSEINLSLPFNSPLAATYLAGPDPVDFTLDINLGSPAIRMYWVADALNGFNQGDVTITYSVPEPAGLAIVGGALLALGAARRRRA